MQPLSASHAFIGFVARLRGLVLTLGAVNEVAVDDGLGAPHCANDLTQMEPAGPPTRPYWRCPICGLRQFA
jgi:hypothetical protein